MKRTLGLLTTALIGLSLLALAACGDDDYGDDSTVGDASPTQTPRPEAEEFDIALQDFSFTPDAIALDVGHSLDIKLQNDSDTAHTFTLDELHIDVEIAPGDEESVLLTASDPGEFTFYCKFHHDRGMAGALRAGIPDSTE